jgi:Domain of unknown function (DUF4190)
MASSPQQPGPGGYGEQPPDPDGYGTPLPQYSGGGGYGDPVPQQPSKAPLVLSIIGIVCWFVFSPAAIVLGLIAQSQYRKHGQRDTLAKVAWIGGVIVLALGIILVATHHSNTTG